MLLLVKSLRANGVFSIIAGLVATMFARSLADTMDIAPAVVYVVGVGVFFFGATILWSSRGSDVDPRFGLGVVAADTSWVVGAIVILVTPGTMDAKWVLALVTIPVALFAYLQGRGLSRIASEIVTTIEIEARPADVWTILIDLESYEDWNPFILEASGSVVEGARLRVRMESMKFQPTVTSVKEGLILEWLGHVGVRGVFDGRHRFELESKTNSTLLTHSELFSGLLTPLFSQQFHTKTRRAFVEMNEALKNRVETRVRNSA